MDKCTTKTEEYEFDSSLCGLAKELHPETATPRAAVLTYGCQMNFRDSELLSGLLQKLGYTLTSEEEEADLVLLNTCTIRETASQRVFGKIGQLKRLKYADSEFLLGVCGCMAQEERTVRKIESSIPHVDLVFGTHNLHRLPQLLKRVQETGEQVIEVWNSRKELVESLPAHNADSVRASINIIFGCDNYCTYCIVPFVRGRECSRPPERILEQFKSLLAAGYRELTLLGQNVNSYGNDFDCSYGFGALLQDLDQLSGNYRIRYMTSHPADFSHELVDIIADSEHVTEHYHLPVQSGSNEILRRMNRGYSREEYLELTEYIHKRDPQASITTDIIVGFPGEDRKQFEDTLSLVEEVQFDNAFTFIYSPREGTAAARWADNTPRSVKQERLEELMKLQHSISLQKNLALEGKQMEVLIEGPSKKEATVLSSRTRTNKLVLIPVDSAELREQLTGEFVEVRIVKGNTWTLEGQLVTSAAHLT